MLHKSQGKNEITAAQYAQPPDMKRTLLSCIYAVDMQKEFTAELGLGEMVIHS